MHADGRGQRRLAGLQGRDDDRPTFSPDGRWLAFASQGADGTSAVYVVRADGTGLRRLTAGTAPAWHP
jgi:Tol biopolymer transport system component